MNMKRSLINKNNFKQKNIDPIYLLKKYCEEIDLQLEKDVFLSRINQFIFLKDINNIAIIKQNNQKLVKDLLKKIDYTLDDMRKNYSKKKKKEYRKISLQNGELVTKVTFGILKRTISLIQKAITEIINAFLNSLNSCSEQSEVLERLFELLYLISNIISEKNEESLNHLKNEDVPPPTPTGEQNRILLI